MTRLAMLALLIGWPFVTFSKVKAETATIRVTGTGTIDAKPTRAEINVQVSGSGELTDDALTKYRSAMKRAKEAFDKLKIENLSIEELGLGVQELGNNQQMVIAPGNPNPNQAKQPITYSRQLRLVLSHIDKMDENQLTETLGNLIDTAKDSGATIGADPSTAMIARMWGQQMTSSLVTFVVENADVTRDKAYAEAMKSARERATKLARLAGVHLAGVHSLNESFDLPEDDSKNPQRLIYAMYGMQFGKEQESRLVSSEFKEMSISVSLDVTFAIKPTEAH